MVITQGVTLLLITALLTVFSLRATLQDRKQTALLLILSLAFVLRIFMAGDLYLHDWDERFHANVAKNIAVHPLSPVLYDDETIDYVVGSWGEGQLWISKPILPFWAMGASISIFGANEIGLRLPSLFFGLLGVWLTFLFGRRLFDERVGLIAAFLHTIHGMLLRFGGGITSSDHVDQLFTLLFAWGVYAYILYTNIRQRRYLLLAGAIIGLAFLTKWIMALFLGFIIAVIHIFIVKRFSDYVQDGLLILFGAILIATPWVLYLFIHHPVELKLVFADFLSRTDEAFEGHSGGTLFYLEQIFIQFRGGILLPLLWLVIVTWKKHRNSQLLLSFWIFLPMLLLSFLTTKRGTYLMMSAPAYFLLTGYFLRWLMWSPRSLRNRWVVIGVCTLLLGLPLQYSVEQVKPFQQRFTLPDWRLNLKRQIVWHERIGNKIVLHGHPHALDAMFYFDVLAYQRRLKPGEVSAFESEGFMVIGPRDKR